MGSPKHPLPKQRYQAHRDLDKVVQRRRVRSSELKNFETRNEEKNLLEALCPICLSGLIQPDSSLPNPPESSPLSTITPVSPTVKPNMQGKEVIPWSGRDIDREAEQDILTLHVCLHTFHAACIVSWFLLRRYDCPLCKAHYLDQNRKGRTIPDGRV